MKKKFHTRAQDGFHLLIVIAAHQALSFFDYALCVPLRMTEALRQRFHGFLGMTKRGRRYATSSDRYRQLKNAAKSVAFVKRIQRALLLQAAILRSAYFVVDIDKIIAIPPVSAYIIGGKAQAVAVGIVCFLPLAKVKQRHTAATSQHVCGGIVYYIL